MSNYEEGSIIEGKVTGIKPFGAFVAIDEKKQGLVHISEVAHGYVKDIADVLTVGDEVKVKVMSVDQESGKISLSIRATQEAPARPQAKPRANTGGGARKPQAPQQKQQGFNTLEDKLKEWLKQSNEIQADLNKRAKK
ncbi:MULTISPECIES: S1 domain-containing post-transcriptional regulator GSP13 [Shouchella]|uniref:General stress protein 13 n=5 Tax=Bacillaceae TaxID=186817 RepID=A0A060M0C1_9BACI|nr:MULTISPECIES: S1 domain-containing post-transcriptional regulator GSP13 [Bacillaceae]RQW21203.1 general stress protein 13 [Bacillus sp. C1-1]GAF23714.1 general stress protein [Bacillus sp. JCM 19047]AIC95470.1 general stress protein 13 [Shouchella lehensis G1]KQL55613.1 RNA-binding protein [Alkalicoccobacillus plakortidis]MBG9783809.1 RNA-binding protein [Shouchella lehensis]